jgi:hypothetical protein
VTRGWVLEDVVSPPRLSVRTSPRGEAGSVVYAKHYSTIWEKREGRGQGEGGQMTVGPGFRHPREHDEQRSTSQEYPPMAIPKLANGHSAPSSSKMSRTRSMRAASCSFDI